MRKTFLALLPALLLLGLLVVPAVGADKKDTFSDADFIKKLYSDGVLEIKLGNLAKDKSDNKDVQAFGKKMAQDHSDANKRLEKIAKALDITLSDKLDKKHQASYDALNKLKGSAFDKAYTKHMVEDHDKAVTMFTKAMNNAKDKDLRDFAKNHLPIIKDHLSLAKKTKDKVSD